MNLVLWIIAVVLAAAFTLGALAQLLLPKDRYRHLHESQHWADDFTAGKIKVIGSVKLLGALGLILPAALDVVPVLTPIAACGLALFMSGAATTRFRRGEWRNMIGDLFFLGAFAFLAWGRFALAPF
jgi:VIT1/CCC1 family predicted Fe2+/Mn2+ transporter